MGDHTETSFHSPRASIRVLRETVAAEARAAGFEIPPNATWYDASTPRCLNASKARMARNAFVYKVHYSHGRLCDADLAATAVRLATAQRCRSRLHTAAQTPFPTSFWPSALEPSFASVPRTNNLAIGLPTSSPLITSTVLTRRAWGVYTGATRSTSWLSRMRR